MIYIEYSIVWICKTPAEYQLQDVFDSKLL